MKTRPNFRKKYANGTNTQGVGPNNYIQSPNEVLNDYNIMLAKVDQEVANNKLVPIVSLVGGLAQQAIKMGAGSPAGAGGTAGAAGALKSNASALVTKAANPATDSIMLQGAEGIVAANGNNNVNSDVEVEGGEMYETPQGDTGEFKGPSHEQGGIPMEVNQDIPEGTKVYSDRLKVGDKTLAERKAARERQVANLEKTAAQPLIDSAIKNATKRKMAAIQKEEIADLQFQEQVNNMQQMADSVIKAFGTSIEGVQENPIGDSMRYAMGTGADGVTEYGNGGIVFGKGYNLSNFQPYLDKYSNSLGGMQPNIDWGDPNNIKAFQRSLGNTEDGVLGKNDYAKASATKFVKPEIVGEAPSFVNNFQGDIEIPSIPSFAKTTEDNSYQIAQDNLITDASPEGASNLDLSQTTAKGGVDLPGNAVGRFMEKAGGAVDKMGGLPGMGDIAGLFGDYLGATSGLKNAAESRSTDVTHRNTMINAGKESQKQLDNAMSSIENSKAQAIVKATTTTQGGKKSGRNSARGVNQMRGMDWLYDTALNEQISTISSNAAAQVSDIFKSKSSVALSADQLKGEGEYKANMANEAAKDAYYTAKGLGLKDQALGVQHIGKDLNAMKQNKMIENLMKNYGTYVTADMKTGKLANKPIPGSNTTTSSNTTAKTNPAMSLDDALKSMNLVKDSSGYVTLPNGKKVLEKDLLTLYSNK